MLTELGFYALAGASDGDLVEEVKAAESLGLGTAFISERFNTKEAAALCGAAGAVSEEIGIATGVTNPNTRHPVVTAAFAASMDRLTKGRFALGLGRGLDRLWDAMGLPRVTTAALEDFAGLLRGMWRGEPIVGYDGPCGKYPALSLMGRVDADVPLMLSAFGPESLKLAGRAFDGVILHTFFTDETLERCVETVKGAAEAAGRERSSVRVWSVLATVPDDLPPDVRRKKMVGRLATYLQGYGDLLVRTNRWDPAALERFRADPIVSGMRGVIDDVATPGELEHIATLLPEEWLAPAATGSAGDCAKKLLQQFDLGADSVILHGCSPAQLAPVLEAYRELRPRGRFDHLPANPARMEVPR